MSSSTSSLSVPTSSWRWQPIYSLLSLILLLLCLSTTPTFTFANAIASSATTDHPKPRGAPPPHPKEVPRHPIVPLSSLPTGNLPLCRVHEDSRGDWYNMTDLHALPIEKFQSILSSRFVLPGGNTDGSHGVPGGLASNWSQIFLTRDCAVHRFTNHSIHHIVKHILDKKAGTIGNKDAATGEGGVPVPVPTAAPVVKSSTATYPNEIHIYIMGDSGTRAVFCGLTRIISGSELYGPCSNTVCGTPATLPISYKQTNQYYDVSFGPSLRFTYVYIKSLLHAKTHTDWILEGAIKSKPYAIIMNTGAWDYDHIARSHMGQSITTEYCDTEETDNVSKERASDRLKNILLELGVYAKQLGVRAIYRNNHHNSRFGTNCADDRLEAILRNKAGNSGTNDNNLLNEKDVSQFVTSIASSTGWEVWDNRHISLDVWKEQNYDGFHFDRHRVHSHPHHVGHMKYFKDRNWILPGQLEIQLAQSLLYTLFQENVEEFLKMKKEITPIWADWPLGPE